MTIHLDLPADIEQALRARAAAEGKAIDALVAETLIKRLARPPAAVNPPQSDRPDGTFAERVQAWIALHPPTAGRIDDSRESIYAGRGE